MPATLTEIARQAGVSVATVSMLLRGNRNLRISETKRQRILAVTDELGGPRIHRGPVRAALNIMTPTTRQFFDRIGEMNARQLTFITCLEAAIKTQGLRLSYTFFDPEMKHAVFDELMTSTGYCAGLLLLSSVVDECVAQRLIERKFPHVSNDAWAEPFGVNTVTVHAQDGQCQAVRYLKELGHEHIGYFWPAQTPGNRYPMFIAAKVQMGLSIDPALDCPMDEPYLSASDNLPEEQIRTCARRSIGRWLDRNTRATALVCQNDRFALDVVAVLRERGLEPGRDLSVIGYDNREVRGPGEVSDHPILTTIDNPTDIVGYRCGELLINQILHQQTQIVHEHIPTKLIVRSSTGPASGDR